MVRCFLLIWFALQLTRLSAVNSDLCIKQTSRFLTFTKANSSDSAVACFHRLLYSCKTIKNELFVQALSAHKAVLNKAIIAKDTAYVHQCIDSLSSLYQQRQKYLGAEAAHYEDFINTVFRVCPSKSRLAYDASSRYLSATTDSASNTILLLHVRGAVASFKRGTLHQSAVLDAVLQTRRLLDQKAAKRPKDPSYKDIIAEINRLFERDVAIDCSSLDAYVSSQYQAFSHDTVSLKIVAWILTIKCPESEQFSVTLLQLSELVKASGLFADIARNFMQQNRLDKAQEYFKKAINLEMDKTRKAYYCYEYALASKSNAHTAYDYCKRAIQYNSQLGAAWLLMAQLVTSNAANCSGIDRKALYCLATNFCTKAKLANPQLAATANKQATLYATQLPTAAELAAANLQSQQNYSLLCWPNETLVLQQKK